MADPDDIYERATLLFVGRAGPLDEDTGEPIGVMRLKARPIATLTIDAQERREMKERVLADR